MANIMRLGGGVNASIPAGYELKYGSLAVSSLEGNKYIPLVVKLDISADDWNGSKPKSYLTDNLKTQFIQLQAPCGVWACYADLYSKYNGNFEKLKAWRKFTGYTGGSHGNWFHINSQVVSTWLEKK